MSFVRELFPCVTSRFFPPKPFTHLGFDKIKGEVKLDLDCFVWCHLGITQKDTGNMTVTSQNGSVVNIPQLTGVNVKRDLTINVNNTYGKCCPRISKTKCF